MTNVEQLFKVLTTEDLIDVNGGGMIYTMYQGEWPPPPYYSAAFSSTVWAARMDAWAHALIP